MLAQFILSRKLTKFLSETCALLLNTGRQRPYTSRKECIKGVAGRIGFRFSAGLSNCPSRCNFFIHTEIITKVCTFFITYHISRRFAAIVVRSAFVKFTSLTNMQICMTKWALISPHRLFYRNFFTAFPANHKYIVSFLSTFYYNKNMFTQNKCLVHYCRNNALSTFDAEGNITDEKNYCLDHIPDPGLAKSAIYKYISEHEKIVGLNASGILFDNVDFSNKKFFGCNFTNCSFINFHADNLVSRMCFFDFSNFNDCSFTHSSMIFSSFSASTFAHSLLTSSNIIQCNFNAIQAFQSSFDDSDLFSSRFIKAVLTDTSFRNCNLKKAFFYDTERNNVSFKMSNTREALFSRNGESLEERSLI